jgi:hypothetical protein
VTSGRTEEAVETILGEVKTNYIKLLLYSLTFSVKIKSTIKGQFKIFNNL